jgi:DNA-directed RNA polymerase
MKNAQESDYMYDLNIAHENRLISMGEDRFITEQKKGRERLVNGKRTKVQEESNTMYGALLVKKYSAKLAYYIEAWVDEFKETKGRTPDIILLLRALDVANIAYITVSTVVDAISILPGQTAIAVHISKRIEDQARFWLFNQAHPSMMKRLKKDWDTRHVQNYTYKRKQLITMERVIRENETDPDKKEAMPVWNPWDIKTHMKLGYAMLDCLINSSSDWTDDGKRIIGSGLIERELETTSKHGKVKTKYTVVATGKTLEMIKDVLYKNGSMFPIHAPILCPPRDWHTPTDGGYHTKEMRKTTPLVKVKTAFERAFMENCIPSYEDGMKTVYDSLNAIQAVPYRVNKKIYEVLEHETHREDGAGLPQLSELVIPDCPIGQLNREDFSSYKEWKEVRQEKLDGLMSDEKRALGKWIEEARELRSKELKRKGKWLGVYQTQYMARMMKDHERFWYVWNLDTRGRAYPLCTSMSPQGDEIGKALVEYADAKPIGSGIEAIITYTATEAGMDKLTVNQMKSWVRENAQMIYDIGQDPIEYREHWINADEPWGFLACCIHFGLAIIMWAKGMDVSKIETRGRVHFDGKCNSTQHFSMMTRDLNGARQVNLLPLSDDETPTDIYGVTSDNLLEKLKGILVTGSPLDRQYAQGIMAFGVDRSLLKKPTMTFTYGGTQSGCLEYLTEYLMENMQECLGVWTTEEPDGTVKTHGGYLRYAKWLAPLMYGSEKEVMGGVTQAMEYIRKVGWSVANSSNNAMVFYTPLGFPVLHWSEDVKMKQVHIYLHGKVIVPKIGVETGKSNQWKMKSKLPPTFVHSLDASHMHTVATKLSGYGIELTPVHDSYGVRPCYAQVATQVIRDEFVDMYREDILQKFAEEQRILNPQAADLIPDVDEHIEYGDLDIELVRDAKRSFF